MPKMGFLSASDFAQIMVKSDISKSVEFFGKGCDTLAFELALKNAGVYFEDGYVSYDMQRGIDLEPTAIDYYQMKNGVEVINRQLWKTDDVLPFLGCHVDGVVGEQQGIIEVKCPNQKNHYLNLNNAAQYHSDYLEQCQGSAMIWGAKWIDFISFDDRYPEHSQLAVHRFEADQAWQDLFRKRAKLFWESIYEPKFKQVQETILNK
jgi:hypothetical protein